MHPRTKDEILWRLKSVVGHTQGVQRMIRDETYCFDIIKQTVAIRNALHQINRLLLQDHLATCVSPVIQRDDYQERERLLVELTELFDTERRVEDGDQTVDLTG
ncbi:MAG: metal-sensitive transcriptional regulator [Anaerolineae bacterium]